MRFKPSGANVFVQEDVIMMIFRNENNSFYIEDDLSKNNPSANNYFLENNKKKCNGGISRIEIHNDYVRFELNEEAKKKIEEEYIEVDLVLESFSDLKKELRLFARTYDIPFKLV